MKCIKKCIRPLALLLVMFVLFFQSGLIEAIGADLTNEEQNKINDIKKQQAELDEKIAQNKKKMNDLKDDMEQQEAYVKTLQGQISNYQEQINLLNSNISLLEQQKSEIQAKIDELDERINEIQGEINHNEILQNDLNLEIKDTYNDVQTRLCDLYMYGRASELELLLDSKDFKSFLVSLELSSSIAEHDQQIITGLKKKIADLDNLNAEHQSLINEHQAKQAEYQADIDDLNAKEDEIKKSKSELQSSQNEIRALESEASGYLAELDRESAAYKALIAQYEADKAAFDKKIDAIIEEAKKRNQPITFTPSGGLICPLQYRGTYISSPYGYRTDPATGSTRFHGGVDLCVSGGTYGKNISAAANGVVLTAAYNSSGYGYYILLDHGNGLYTLYGHNSQLLVSTGQTVTQGQTIAKAGSTGYSTGPHCHFEVRLNGNYVDPMQYFR